VCDDRLAVLRRIAEGMSDEETEKFIDDFLKEKPEEPQVPRAESQT